MASVACQHLTDYTGWKKIPIDKLFTAYFLIQGGIDNPVDLRDLTGYEIRNVEGVIDIVERLIYGPLQVSEPVRCGECGAKLVEIPCRVCRKRLNFRRVGNDETAVV